MQVGKDCILALVDLTRERLDSVSGARSALPARHRWRCGGRGGHDQAALPHGGLHPVASYSPVTTHLLQEDKEAMQGVKVSLAAC